MARVLARLGWTETLRQQNLSARGREDVPDGLLFADDTWRRTGQTVSSRNGDATNWVWPWLSRSAGCGRWTAGQGRRGEETAPSTQMLRYLRRIDDLTSGELRWGILTNGARWRLYYQGARSVSEQFFECESGRCFSISPATTTICLP